MKHPRLRDSKNLITKELYPIGEIPDEIIRKIGGYFVYLLYMGRSDISGEDWGDAFAKAIGGTHLDSPVGIADVIYEKMAWSMKTLKSPDPFTSRTVRLISGRCSPDYSYGINNPHEDIEQTGRAVLGIWNERVNIAQDHFSPIRTSILIRSDDLLSYRLFETENHRYVTSNYYWETNRNGNLVGKDKTTHAKCFTWQPHGSQFTIHESVPANAIKFTIKKPAILTHTKILDTIGFDDSWVEIIR